MRPSPSHSPLTPSMFPYEMPERSNSPNRRQRISMACQYCRHRKIRCCGGSPCRNCIRSQRDCGYAPVPEEVNRATREKKAIAKAAKIHLPTAHSPFLSGSPMFSIPQRPIGHRRSISVPSIETQPWLQTPPMVHTPTIYEKHWAYNNRSPAQAVPAYPSVLEPPNPPFYSHPPATPPSSRSGSSEMEMPWSTPNPHLRVPVLTPHDHQPSPIFYSPHPTPPLYHPVMYPNPMGQQISPTLAPEMPPKDLVGLGIGMEGTPTFAPRY